MDEGNRVNAMKKIAASAIALLLVFSLAACRASSPDEQSGTEIPSVQGSSANGSGRRYISDYVKGDCSITSRGSYYGSEELYESKFIKTSAGYYYKTKEHEKLFILNQGGLYDTYVRAEEGFEKDNSVPPKLQTQIEAEASLYIGFTTRDSLSEDVVKTGSGTMLGRECDLYEYRYPPHFDDLRDITYYIDKATDVCLKSIQRDGKILYECTGFETSGVSLPAYN